MTPEKANAGHHGDGGGVRDCEHLGGKLDPVTSPESPKTQTQTTGPPDQERYKAAQHAEIRYRYDWHRREKRSVKPKDIGPIRIGDLERLFQHRYGSILPGDDSGRDDLQIVVEHLWFMAYPQERIATWSSRWAPWMPEHDLAQIVDDAGAHPRRLSAQQLGERLALTYAERKALKITTIRCVDKTQAEVAALQKEEKRHRDRERQRGKREADRKNAELRCSPNPIELSMRADAVFSAIGKRWKTVNSICRDVAGSPAFEGLSRDSLKMTVHRIIKEPMVAQYIEQKVEQLPGRLKTKVRRSTMVP
jgi:hypothetical protein